MTRQTHIIQPIPQLPVSRRGMKRWWLSAIVYRTLCVWLGPTAAFWLTVIGAWTLCGSIYAVASPCRRAVRLSRRRSLWLNRTPRRASR